MDRQEILNNTTFGEIAAEFEEHELQRYFLATTAWTKLLKDKIDILYGAKGSGKSAHYLLLLHEADSLREQGIIIVNAENPSGAPAFSALNEGPPVGEKGFVNLWKLYFLSLLGDLLKQEVASGKEAAQVIKVLEDAKLIEKDASLQSRLMSVFRYVHALEIEPNINIASFTPGVKARIEFTEPTGDRIEKGYISIDALLFKANQALERLGFAAWILMDRLDAAFSDSGELETLALRGLYQAYRDVGAFNFIQLKIFLRTDIWQRLLAESGMREAVHQREYTIEWNSDALFNLMIRRLVQNDVICETFAVDGQKVLADIAKQKALFAEVFPEQVEPGDRQRDTLGWILSRIEDGAGIVNPRELIHLLNATRDAELERLHQGKIPPTYSRWSESLFSPESIKEALVTVSRTRLERTIYAEYPALRPRIEDLRYEDLRGERYTFSPSRLAQIWNTDSNTAMIIANQLADVGMFARRGKSHSPTYWLPFLYRDALDVT